LYTAILFPENPLFLGVAGKFPARSETRFYTEEAWGLPPAAELGPHTVRASNIPRRR